MNEETFEIHVPQDIAPGKRLDRFLAEDLALGRRSQIKNQLLEVTCNGRPAKLSTRLTPGDHLRGRIAALASPDATAQPIPLNILHEEPTFLVIDKPQGLVVHPGAGNPDGTVVNALMWRYREDPFFNTPQDAVRPGIVHRLDKDTSGVMIIAKEPDTHHHLVEQFSKARVEKRYLAIVRGTMRAREGVIDAPLGRDPGNRQRFTVDRRRGKQARTAWHVLRRMDGYTLVMLCPTTGRTHQLRVHLAELGTPILGDPIYTRRDPVFPDTSLMLHAITLKIVPGPGRDPLLFRTAVPERFHEILRSLRR